PVRGRVLAGVAQQVADHLLEPERIAVDPERTLAERPRDAQLLAVDLMPLRFQRGLDEHPEIDQLAFELDASSGDARNVEQVVEQSREMLGLIPNQRSRARGPRRPLRRLRSP